MRFPSKNLGRSVLLLGVIAGMSACSSDDGSSSGKVVVLELVSSPPATTFSDIGEPGPSVGDLYTFSASVTEGDTEVGRLVGTKVLVTLPGDAGLPDGVGRFQNQLTFIFADGTISVTGWQPYPLDKNDTEAVAFVQTSSIQRAIVGGTGIYAGASGVLTTSEDASGGRKQHFEFTVNGSVTSGAVSKYAGVIKFPPPN